jgi:hypothetical protein
MRLMFLGDVVGRPGREALYAAIPDLRARYRLDLLIVNGENAAGGFGITETILREMLDLGVDVVTLGNHAFDQRETLVYIERYPQLLRPINYPPGTPGKGAGLFTARNGADVLVINAMGRTYMAELDCPFRAVEQAVEACGLKRGADAIFVDMHAEATSEKQALACLLDGRISALVGTHTHAPTADDRVLPAGTAYLSDAGMCGCYDSVLGMDKEEPITRFVTRLPRGRFEPADGPGSVAGFAVEIDDTTGLATRCAVYRAGPHLKPAAPDWWA